MENVINKYETIFVIDTTVGEEATASLVAKFKDLIAANGTVDNVDEWGKRRLAYEIDHKREGYYTLIEFSSQAEFIAELERVYRITDGIIRSIVIRKEQ